MENPNDESTPKSLTDLPIDRLVQIIDELDYKEQLILRKVSKPLRSLVDEQKPNCKSINVVYQNKKVSCQYNIPNVVYLECSRDERESKFTRIVQNDNYEFVALDDLKWTLSNPKLKLNGFKLASFSHSGSAESTFSHEVYDKMENMLHSLNQQVSTKTLTIRHFTVPDLLKLLPYIKPGVLKRIILKNQRYYQWNESESLEAFGKLAETEQWKQVVELDLRYADTFPMEYATHFKRFTLQHFTFEEDTLNELVKSFSKCTNFERCLLEPISNRLPERDGTKPPTNEGPEFVRHFPIPDSNDYLEIQFFSKYTMVKKMNN